MAKKRSKTGGGRGTNKYQIKGSSTADESGQFASPGIQEAFEELKRRNAAAAAAGSPSPGIGDSWEMTVDHRHLPVVRRIVDDANKRSERWGFGRPYSVEVVEELVDDSSGVPRLGEVRLRVESTGIRVGEDGWTVTGVAKSEGDATMLYGDVSTGREAVDFSVCQQCGQKRARSKLIELRSDDGEVLLVGGECAKRYLGDGGIDRLVLSIAGLDDELSELSEKGVNYAVKSPDPIPSRSIVAMAIRQIAADGGEYFNTYSDRSTKGELVRQLYSGEWLDASNSDEDWAAADELIEWVRAQPTTEIGYMANLREAVDSPWVSERSIGLLASAWSARESQRQREVRRVAKEAARANSSHVGVVGERLKGVSVTVTGVQEFDSEFGVVRFVNMVDGSGNALRTKSSGLFGARVDVGDEVVVNGTVSEHGSFDGVRQTMLSRVALVEPAE